MPWTFSAAWARSVATVNTVSTGASIRLVIENWAMRVFTTEVTDDTEKIVAND